MEKAISSAQEFLKYESLTAVQQSVIKGYLVGKDVLLCSPTGSGKSLNFEIAPLIFKNLGHEKPTVIVVSPLVALMRYQVEGLLKKNVRAVYLEEMECCTMGDIISGEVEIIFSSPESLLGKHRTMLTELTKNDAVRAIFIDEAHCVKKYGQGNPKRKLPAYRPSYGKLGELRSLVLRNVPIIAMTATADASTRSIIKSTLCLTDPIEIIVTPEKKNVKYSVLKAEKDIHTNFSWLVKILSQYGKACPRVLVFFRQIKQIAEVFEYLQTSLKENQYVKSDCDKDSYKNRLFAMFHLMTNDKIKQEVCASFQDPEGTIRIVLCSTSFSMGLDVKNVNTVVHFGPANDIDDYLQESGRAGRDPYSKCSAVLIDYKYSLSSQNISKAMKEYVRATTCRRVLLLKQFDSSAVPVTPKHDCCDICSKQCSCLCSCTYDCKCTLTCSQTDSEIVALIQQSIITNTETSSSSSNEEFSSDSDIEKYMLGKPHVVYESDSN